MEAEAIFGLITQVSALVEQYGPELYQAIRNLIEANENPQKITLDMVNEMYNKCKSVNNAIQNT